MIMAGLLAALMRRRQIEKEDQDYLDNLTWRCEICGKERPDNKISVISYQLKDFLAKVEVNVKYCNDKESCINGAFKKARSQKL